MSISRIGRGERKYGFQKIKDQGLMSYSSQTQGTAQGAAGRELADVRVSGLLDTGPLSVEPEVL